MSTSPTRRGRRPPLLPSSIPLSDRCAAMVEATWAAVQQQRHWANGTECRPGGIAQTAEPGSAILTPALVYLWLSIEARWPPRIPPPSPGPADASPGRGSQLLPQHGPLRAPGAWTGLPSPTPTTDTSPCPPIHIRIHTPSCAAHSHTCTDEHLSLSLVPLVRPLLTVFNIQVHSAAFQHPLLVPLPCPLQPCSP